MTPVYNSSPTVGTAKKVVRHLPYENMAGRKELKVPHYFQQKKACMRCAAGLLIVCLAPVIGVALLLVKITSRGPSLYKQTRLGLDGTLFQVCKIRTMYADAENLSGPTLCQPKDSRITPVGKVLRCLHIDELPQLLNVIRGEMCLVGPRPERPEIVDRHQLDQIVPDFHLRLSVLPGVTGLAQINLPPDQSAECVIPKVQLDLEYITTASASLDLRILLCSAFRMLGIRHGRAVRLFRLNRQPKRLSSNSAPTTETKPQHFPQSSVPISPQVVNTLLSEHSSSVQNGSHSSFAPGCQEFDYNEMQSTNGFDGDASSTRKRPR